MTQTERNTAHNRTELSEATDAELIVASADDPRAFLIWQKGWPAPNASDSVANSAYKPVLHQP